MSSLVRGCSRLLGGVARTGAVVRAPIVRTHSSWNYRTAPPLPPRSSIIIAELAGGLMWWWVLWHIFTEPGHLVGEWPRVDPADWTDSELGIPADSAGPAAKLN